MTTQPRNRRRGIIAAGITTGVVALTLIVLAAAGLAASTANMPSVTA